MNTLVKGKDRVTFNIEDTIGLFNAVFKTRVENYSYAQAMDEHKQNSG